MIARIWRGVTTAELADEYLTYMQETGLGEYTKTPGNRGVLTLRRIVDGKAEFVLISMWESEEAIRNFTGADMLRAVYYPEDERFLVEKDDFVTHFEVMEPLDCADLPRD